MAVVKLQTKLQTKRTTLAEAAASKPDDAEMTRVASLQRVSHDQLHVCVKEKQKVQ